PLAEPIELLLVLVVHRGISVWRSERRWTVSVAAFAIRWPVWTLGGTVRTRRAARFPCATAAQLTGPNTGGHVWPAVVRGSMQSPICAGGSLMLCLHRSHGAAPLMRRGDFSICRPGSYASRATAEADSVSRLVDHGRVVSVAHNRDVHVGHGAVVEVRAASPVSTEEANAGVAEAVVDSAIVADLRSPVAGVPEIEAVPSPIPWSPEQADFRWLHPSARNPEVAVRTVSPIAWSPDVAGFRTDGLDIHWQRRRTNSNGDAHHN